MNPLILIFLGGLILTAGDFFMKKWVDSNDSYQFIYGILLYLVSMVILGYSFKFKNIAVASTIMVIFNVVTLMLLSWGFFDEKLSTAQIFGIFFGILAVIFCEL